MDTSSYSIFVNQNEGDGWQEWSKLLTKQEASEELQQVRAWVSKHGFQWSFKLAS